MTDNGPMNGRGPGRPRGTSHAEIRDIALELFLEQGYAATSLVSIAREAGVSRTTLFAYFRTKRDIIWADHDLRAADIDHALDSGPTHPVVELIQRGLLVNAHYGVEEHAALAARMRLTEREDELRAYATLIAQDTSERVLQGVIRRVPEADPAMIGLVSAALSAAASRCLREWASQERPTVPLEEHVAQGVRPLVEALRPLLP